MVRYFFDPGVVLVSWRTMHIQMIITISFENKLCPWSRFQQNPASMEAYGYLYGRPSGNKFVNILTLN